MWTMENGAHTVERDAHPRSPAFLDFRPIEQQHCFNIRPRNVDAFLENRFQHALVPVNSTTISKTDISMDRIESGGAGGARLPSILVEQRP
jgi:hypothetical protein